MFVITVTLSSCFISDVNARFVMTETLMYHLVLQQDEFHTRLRFVRRGLVAMANAGPHDNGSQFFFTMNQTPELQNKHTIFGKVGGETVYNMLKLQEVAVDANERPQYPHKIIRTEVGICYSMKCCYGMFMSCLVCLLSTQKQRYIAPCSGS